MTKVKLKERIENALEAFFDNEKPEDSKLTVHYADSTSENTPRFSEKTRTAVNVLRQIFLFLPGAVVLFFISVLMTAFLLLRPGNGRPGPLFITFIVAITSALLTVLGLGDWRKPRHLLIPLSIVVLGVASGVVSSIFFGRYGFGDFLRNYLPYLIPPALIAPVLVKGWLDKSEG